MRAVFSVSAALLLAACALNVLNCAASPAVPDPVVIVVPAAGGVTVSNGVSGGPTLTRVGGELPTSGTIVPVTGEGFVSAKPSVNFNIDLSPAIEIVDGYTIATWFDADSFTTPAGHSHTLARGAFVGGDIKTHPPILTDENTKVGAFACRI